MGPRRGMVVRGKNVNSFHEGENRSFLFCGELLGYLPKHDLEGNPVLQRLGGVRPGLVHLDPEV